MYVGLEQVILCWMGLKSTSGKVVLLWLLSSSKTMITEDFTNFVRSTVLKSLRNIRECDKILFPNRK